jgi:hypothetical protein
MTGRKEIVVCRQNASTPETWMVLERHPGARWSVIEGQGNLLENLIRNVIVKPLQSLVEPQKRIDLSAIANISITTRDSADVKAAPPPTDPAWSDVSDMPWPFPGRAITCLAPTGLAPGHLWATVTRSGAREVLHSMSTGIFAEQTLAEQILRHWAGPDDDPSRRFREFASRPDISWPEDFWVRPDWLGCRLVPSIVPPALAPTKVPQKALDRLAGIRENRRLKQTLAQQKVSQGFVRSGPNSWARPAGDE